jgi:plastocyanin domain-containing protein
MTVEVTPDKFIDFGFACGMHILKFVYRLEFNDIQAVRKHTVRFPF